MDNQNEKKEITLREFVSIMNQRFDSFEQKLEQRLDLFEQRLYLMENEIKTIKLTQNFNKMINDKGLSKPMDNVSLVSFLTETEEINSFFEFNR